jgi:hypothetical protein
VADSCRSVLSKVLRKRMNKWRRHGFDANFRTSPNIWDGTPHPIAALFFDFFPAKRRSGRSNRGNNQEKRSNRLRKTTRQRRQYRTPQGMAHNNQQKVVVAYMPRTKVSEVFFTRLETRDYRSFFPARHTHRGSGSLSTLLKSITSITAAGWYEDPNSLPSPIRSLLKTAANSLSSVHSFHSFISPE